VLESVPESTQRFNSKSFKILKEQSKSSGAKLRTLNEEPFSGTITSQRLRTEEQRS